MSGLKLITNISLLPRRGSLGAELITCKNITSKVIKNSGKNAIVRYSVID